MILVLPYQACLFAVRRFSGSIMDPAALGRIGGILPEIQQSGNKIW